MRVERPVRRSVPGAVTIYLLRAAGSGDLVLDFRGLAVLEVMANEEVVEDYTHRDGHILIPAARLQDGPNAVAIRFVSAMAPSGAGIIRFDEPVPGAPPGAFGDSYRYSLLVPADANLLFPSFDQPDLKAIFRLEVIAPEGSTVLSNAPEADRSLSDQGLWTRFEPTEPISVTVPSWTATPIADGLTSTSFSNAWRITSNSASSARSMAGSITIWLSQSVTPGTHQAIRPARHFSSMLSSVPLKVTTPFVTATWIWRS